MFAAQVEGVEPPDEVWKNDDRVREGYRIAYGLRTQPTPKALEVLGDPERTWHVGPVGAGQAAKLMLNLVLGGVTAAVAEGYVLGRVLGLSPDTALDVLEGASVATQTVRSKRDKLRSGDYGDPGFRLALMHKDLRLAVDAARAARASLPGTERVAELYAGAKGRGLADQDYAAVAAYLASMAPLLEHNPPEG